MVEDSPADGGPQDEREGFLHALRRRLFSNRFPLGGSLLLFTALAASGLLHWSVAFTCMAAMWAISMFAPVRSSKERRAELSHRSTVEMDVARTRVVIDSLPNPVMLLDRRGTIWQVNRACGRYFGDTLEQGASVLLRFRSPELLSMINEALAGGAPRPVEVVERYPIERWFEATVVGLPAEAMGEASFLLHFRDLSEIRRIDRMRSDFIANASHELRTPLASLSGFIETLSGPARNDAAARDRFFPIMKEQADRMSRLIDDLLSLSRLETALANTEFEPVDIVEVLRHVRASLTPTAGEAGVELIEDFSGVDAEDCRVWGSRDELIQVFSNLIENAIRYAATGKQIDILGERLPVSGVDSIRVTIRDYGPGIEEDHIPRLTERFYRVDVESSRAKKGTGLGLAIVKHILTRHVGRLSITSAVGKGASFIVTIPAWSEKSVAASTNSKEKSKT
ncbi:MAG: two-component sensor histidine kinase [Ahrensia sp.]|nr:two-component sensor histidine kinase [Ahrensia sp.]|tara:strand:+ start:6334 stop:7692 length:1359 start_codon:yes stop_codon:yes gene_type:complete